MSSAGRDGYNTDFMMRLRTSGPALRTTVLWSAWASFLLLPALGSSGPPKWDLCLTLRVEGVYQVTVKGVTYDGDYAFTLAWSGTMEEDDEDYRLVRREVRLLDWRAYETTAAPGIRAPKTTVDFPEPPAFHHFYVLSEKGSFQVAFALSGPDVPVHDSGDKISLVLPRTAKSPPDEFPVNYDAHVRRGSNDLRLPLALIFGEPLERTFDWSFEQRQWILGQEQIVFLSNTHRAQAVVRLRPLRGERP